MSISPVLVATMSSNIIGVLYGLRGGDQDKGVRNAISDAENYESSANLPLTERCAMPKLGEFGKLT